MADFSTKTLQARREYAESEMKRYIQGARRKKTHQPRIMLSYSAKLSKPTQAKV
jgi:hypothetical protein